MKRKVKIPFTDNEMVGTFITLEESRSKRNYEKFISVLDKSERIYLKGTKEEKKEQLIKELDKVKEEYGK